MANEDATQAALAVAVHNLQFNLDTARSLGYSVQVRVLGAAHAPILDVTCTRTSPHALEWRRGIIGGRSGYVADARGAGQYMIRPIAGRRSKYFALRNNTYLDNTTYDSLPAAKAACQKHFEEQR